MSLEQHLRTVLTEAVRTQKRLILQTAKACREQLERELGGTLPNRTDDQLREMRD